MKHFFEIFVFLLHFFVYLIKLIQFLSALASDFADLLDGYVVVVLTLFRAALCS